MRAVSIECAELLMCPVCGGRNLHQYRVDAFFRQREDSPSGTHVRTGSTGCSAEDHVCGAPGGNSTTIDENMAGNPSDRRDGMVVSFWCEGGCADPMLAIVQHKGETMIYWQ